MPQTGQTVLAHYSGWIYEDGQKGDLFDRSRGNPFDFVLGTGQVIRGWDEAFANMRPGAKRILIIPPDLAYGRSGAPGLIPPNATLWFEVEFVGTR
ncbi:MAG: FKBP-type peptidyl-prolyl cis-trans isomerase [Alphaproteobacteria bacterium]|nr:FKBP-type peptidyl-prolyl cis-trans isomerase [Alphaproteobacteria bacterium]